MSHSLSKSVIIVSGAKMFNAPFGAFAAGTYNHLTGNTRPTYSEAHPTMTSIAPDDLRVNLGYAIVGLTSMNNSMESV